MSATFSVTMIDSSGNAKVGLDVDLYTGDGGAGSSKVGDFTDNGDGTYKITVSSSGKYTVKVGGVIQTELQNIYIVVDDVLKSSDVVNDLTTGGTTVPLSAEMGKTLQTTKVNVSDIINDLITGGTTKPLSAEMGKTLNANKMSAADIINDLTTGGTTKPLSAEMGKTLKNYLGSLSFAVENILNSGKDITQNLELLQSAILQLRGTAISGHLIYSDHVTDTTPSGTLSFPEYSIINNANYQDAIMFAYMKQSGITKLRAIFEAKYTDVPGGPTGYVLLEAKPGVNTYLNIPIVTSYTQFEITISDIDTISPNEILPIKIQIKNSDTSSGFIIRKVQIYAE